QHEATSTTNSQAPVSGGAASDGSGSVARHGHLTGTNPGVPPTPAPAGNTLTPGLVGLLNRQGVPPAAYRASEGGYDVQGTNDDQGDNDSGDVSWAELQ